MRTKSSVSVDHLTGIPNFGAGEKSLFAAVIWRAFQDCYASQSYLQIEAAKWLLVTGIEYWRWLGLDDDLYSAALDKMMPPSIASYL